MYIPRYLKSLNRPPNKYVVEKFDNHIGFWIRVFTKTVRWNSKPSRKWSWRYFATIPCFIEDFTDKTPVIEARRAAHSVAVDNKDSRIIEVKDNGCEYVVWQGKWTDLA